MSLRLTGTVAEPDFLFLPWNRSLEEWPEDLVVALPRGISRHVVRFVRINGVVYALKELPEPIAEREYALLWELTRRGVPCVEAAGIVSGRVDATGEELSSILVTRHLQFALPYRALFSSTLREDTANRLLDALAALLVQLHLTGFAWNDCSLSNTLFRRDADHLAAYLVDAETGEMHDTLTVGQREYDLDTAATHVTGELMDLAAGGRLHESIDPVEIGVSLRSRYDGLWHMLTTPLVIGVEDCYLLDAHIRQLNERGFDIAELSIVASADGTRVRVIPKVVDAGHHSRRLLRLTGLDVEEYQARRLLNDLDTFRAQLVAPPEGEDVLAHRWMMERFEWVTARIPRDLRGKLEPAQVFHEVLEHQWFMSERAGRDVGLHVATEDYVTSVLAVKPDEAAVLGARPGSAVDETAELRILMPGEPDRETGEQR